MRAMARLQVYINQLFGANLLPSDSAFRNLEMCEIVVKRSQPRHTSAEWSQDAVQEHA